MNVEHCGASENEVAICRQCNAVTPSSRVPAAILPSLLALLRYSLTVGHTCSMKEMDWGKTVVACGGSNGEQYKYQLSQPHRL